MMPANKTTENCFNLLKTVTLLINSPPFHKPDKVNNPFQKPLSMYQANNMPKGYDHDIIKESKGSQRKKEIFVLSLPLSNKQIRPLIVPHGTIESVKSTTISRDNPNNSILSMSYNLSSIVLSWDKYCSNSHNPQILYALEYSCISQL